jgi:hypothetical protein
MTSHPDDPILAECEEIDSAYLELIAKHRRLLDEARKLLVELERLRARRRKLDRLREIERAQVIERNESVPLN